jgi:hypothetical protein
LAVLKEMTKAPFGYVCVVARKKLPFMPVGLQADNVLFNAAVNMLVNMPSIANEPEFHLKIIAKLKETYTGPYLSERLSAFYHPGALLAMYTHAKNCTNKSGFNIFKLDMDALNANVITISSTSFHPPTQNSKHDWTLSMSS